ncbi:MAG: NAD-dependent DNA ligase LigA [Lachnospiraceae bacterium]|nr:NAD-dependent DNA ligase LigA [Lachnospiraceae bacterium]
MEELSRTLREASKAYYAEDREIFSNLEYDRLYDELLALEKETGIVLASSPTQQVGYEAVKELPKERHERSMLSLDKTKSREELAAWLDEKEGLLSWKMDGLTIVLTYEGGSLQKAVTRGNGEIGEVVTANAKVFENIPLTVPFAGRLILRGEAVIRYSDFEKINASLSEEEGAETRYKNPRNLCSGSVRQLNSAVTASRHVRFYAFSLVEADGFDAKNSRAAEFDFLKGLGFDVVPHVRVTSATVAEAVGDFERQVAENDVPSDGLVLLYDDIAYGASLGTTSKFPRNAIAFKWADETQETTLLDVEWSASRTGLINPVAIFEPVELEGTTVQRASVHNISIVKSLQLGIGDRILVYKANMIIPQIAENLTKSGTLPIPETCPVCGGKTVIRQENDTEALYCTNAECPAKQLKAFSLFVSRNAMNIEGLSEMTLEKYIGEGYIRSFADIYRLSRYRDRIVTMEGFGEKSCDNLLAAIEKSRVTTPERVLGGIGIPGIGVSGARLLSRHFDDDLDRIRSADEEELSSIDGIGPVLASQIHGFFADPAKRQMLDDLLAELTIRKQERMDTSDSPIAGKTFVITGAVHHFENRDALKAYIDERGGKTTGSVTSKTDYLINNDKTSGSSKNKKAAELQIPVISEEEFLSLCGQPAAGEPET